MLTCPRCDEPHDYIPNGRAATTVTNVRPVPPFTRLRCGFQTSYDIQSGPIYCGERAVVVADAPQAGSHAAACKRHEHLLRDMEIKPAPTYADHGAGI